MSRGRKPKPTSIKLLDGTRDDRINHAEPAPRPGLPDCPAILDAAARQEWDRILPELDAAGVLTTLDGPALSLYCSAYSRWQQAEEEIANHGLLTTTDQGSLKANPAVAISRQARAEMARLLAEFGATPSSRSRVKAAHTEAPKDALSDFLKHA